MSTNQETNESFKIFKYTTMGANDCIIAAEHMPSENTTDAQSNEICCGCMKCTLCWPLYIVADILSCPIRGCIHIKNKK
jgi:hypothetical protein